MNSGISTVSAELGLRLVVSQEVIVPLVASLYYDKDDPYAVRMAFHVGLDEPVEWTFARELLAMGAEGIAGLGDVKIWPSADPDSDLDGVVLNLELTSSYGQAHFEAPAGEISTSSAARTRSCRRAGKASTSTSRQGSRTCSARPPDRLTPAGRSRCPGQAP